jgi:hypothetical protein
MKAVGDTCFPERDKEFRAALDQAIFRADRFILVNANATPEALEARKKAGLKELQGENICKNPDTLGMYQQMRDRGPGWIKSAADDLLSVPRKPVMNPCL